MGVTKTEVNLRLLASAPQQQNQAKLIHYTATLREQLEELDEERTPEGLPRISKAKVNDYSEKIEAIASRIAAPLLVKEVSEEPFSRISVRVKPYKTVEENPISKCIKEDICFGSLDRPPLNNEDGTQDVTEADTSAPVKVDAATQSHNEKQRKLQDDLTDEMVGLAQQLKESSLLISRSVHNTEKIVDSTEKAVEQSLASTYHANVRAMQIYSESSKTSCFTWLLIFAMTCIFIMVVLLIRVT